MNSMLMRGLMIGLTALSGSLALSAQVVVSSGFEQLDRWASECLAERSMTLGYPGNNDIRLEEFYRWYTGKTGFDSISVSGHKFFGIDSPCGLFITTRDVYDNQSTYGISYLNANMRMINCSRSGIEPLKFWWLMKTVGDEGWTEQAARIFENTRYLKSELKRIGWPYWNNEYSNTVIFRRPSAKVVRKYNLACSEDAAFGGKLSHVVVMQHVTKDSIDRLIADLRNETISDL